MSQRQDCRDYGDRRAPCTGRDFDEAGKQIPCEHNGFIGVPLARVVEYGRSAQKEGIRSDLSPGVDKRRWKAPSLKPEGREFKPTAVAPGVPVGSLLTWEQDGARRSGQVWSRHWRPGVVWVAPEDGGQAVALNVKTLDVITY